MRKYYIRLLKPEEFAKWSCGFGRCKRPAVYLFGFQEPSKRNVGKIHEMVAGRCNECGDREKLKRGIACPV